MFKRYDINFNTAVKKQEQISVDLDYQTITMDIFFLLDQTNPVKLSIRAYFNETIYLHLNSKRSKDEMLYLFVQERETIYKNVFERVRLHSLFITDSNQKKAFNKLKDLNDLPHRIKIKNYEIEGDNIPPTTEYMILSNIKYDFFYDPKLSAIEQYIAKQFDNKKTSNSVKTSIFSFYDYIFVHRCSHMNDENEELINKFIEFETSREITEAFLNKKLSHILGFLYNQRIFIDKQKINKLDRTKESIDFKEIEAKVTRALNNSEMLFNEAVKKTYITLSKIRDHYRNLILIKLMIHTAARIDEVLQLKFDNIDLENNYVLFQDRKVPIPAEFTKELQTYIQFREEKDLQIDFEKKFSQNGFNITTVISGIDLTQDTILDSDHKNAIVEIQIQLENGEEITIPEDILYSHLCFAYHKQHFVPNNHLFISNRYKKISEITMQGNLRKKFSIVSEDIRKYSINKLLQTHTEQEVRKILGLKTNVDIRYV
ncbi:site-specific integrase [Bacillus sp. BML-BC060]|uniref:site-specific integrase n=1 Tax=Bacillus sp. BML-BC060 TaxID=2842487 RepID=UPI001C7EA374|nr:site-specific integrase [Bacillus sp. BML-BC060]